MVFLLPAYLARDFAPVRFAYLQESMHLFMFTSLPATCCLRSATLLVCHMDCDLSIPYDPFGSEFIECQ